MLVAVAVVKVYEWSENECECEKRARKYQQQQQQYDKPEKSVYKHTKNILRKIIAVEFRIRGLKQFPFAQSLLFVEFGLYVCLVEQKE